MTFPGSIRSTLQVAAGAGVTLWALVLLYVASQIPLRFDIEAVALAVLTLCLIIAEWPWRRRGMHFTASALRGVVVVSALFWLDAATDTYSIVRNGFSETVTEVGGGELTPFMSGVWTMKAAVDRALASAGYPVFLLTAQAVAAGARSLFVAYWVAPGHGTAEVVVDADA